MKPDPSFNTLSKEHVEYQDLIDPEADHEIVGLIHDLDAVFAGVCPPDDLTHAQLQQSQRGHEQRSGAMSRARWTSTGSLTQFVPRSLGRAVAAVAIMALLLTGVAFAGETLLNRVFRMDPGTEQILQDDQYQAINVSHSFAGATLTVERAYADANHIIVAYTVRLAGGTAPDPLVAVSLRTRSGAVLPVRGGAGYTDRTTSTDVTSFDAADIRGAPSAVSLRLEARAQAGPRLARSGGWTLRFHFTRAVWRCSTNS
jgi:Domain of unknown function (DUF4179)